MNKLLAVFLVIVLLGIGGYFFLNNQKSLLPVRLPQGNVCDFETKTCSDGTVLNKQPPSCDFPPCPANEKITVKGEMICLPHKNSSGPQTMECAMGMKADDGNNYGLSDPGWKYLIGVGNGTRIEVTGKLTQKQDQKYNTVGTIEIENLVSL